MSDLKKREFAMKKFLTCLLSLSLLSLSACGDNKITQQVNIDKSLLDALQGKNTSKDGGSTTTTPSPTPTASADSASDSENEAIYAAIRDNADALNNRNYAQYISSFHPTSPYLAYMPTLYYQLTGVNTRYVLKNMQVSFKNATLANVVVNRDTIDDAGTLSGKINYTLGKSGSDWKVGLMEASDQ